MKLIEHVEVYLTSPDWSKQSHNNYFLSAVQHCNLHISYKKQINYNSAPISPRDMQDCFGNNWLNFQYDCYFGSANE